MHKPLHLWLRRTLRTASLSLALSFMLLENSAFAADVKAVPAADIPSVPGSAATSATSELASVILPGVSSGVTVLSYLRFSNGDSTAQTATVHLRDPDTGAILYTWTTPTIQPGGTNETAVVGMIADGVPGLVPEKMPPTLVAEVVSAFSGRVQHVTITPSTGTLYHVSTCGGALLADPLSLPYVTGPRRSDVVGLVRVTNRTAASASLTLTFRDNRGQSSVWTSPVVAPKGTYMRSVRDIASLATPPLSADANSLSVVADAAPPGMSLSYSEGLIGVMGLDDFSASCVLTSVVAAPDSGAGTAQTLPKPSGDATKCPEGAHAMPLGDGATFCMF